MSLNEIRDSIIREFDEYIEGWNSWHGHELYENRVIAMTIAKRIVEKNFYDYQQRKLL